MRVFPTQVRDHRTQFNTESSRLIVLLQTARRGPAAWASPQSTSGRFAQLISAAAAAVPSAACSLGRSRAKSSTQPRCVCRPLAQLAARDVPRLQVAGYSTVYDVSAAGSGSFEFITVSEERALVRWAHKVRCAMQVKGGRHEVPETAPQQAFEMLQVWFAGLFTLQLEE